MDFIKNAANSFSGNDQEQQQQQQHGHQQQTSSGETGQQQQHHQQQQQQQQQGGIGGFFGGLKEKANAAAGGGRESEANEDYLDKGVDFVQEKFMGQGPQDNESAVEQAKDEQISDYIRSQFKSTTGQDVPIKDKPTRLG